jgi:dolichyl-phosphate-mannose--protein O-mannosyl transferase
LYIGIFVVHFSLIKDYSPCADKVIESYQQDLREGTDTTSFWKKFVNWHVLVHDYEKGIGPLDYAKGDEIGSDWLTWPVMARPISYYWGGGNGADRKFVYLLGNPVVWLLGLGGIVVLSGLGISRLFSRNDFRFRHALVLLLYFSNWLPFALISRVMYLYHYIPALIFSVVAFALVINDFVIPRLGQFDPAKLWGIKIIYKKFEIKRRIWGSLLTVGLVGGILIIVMLCFYAYAPMTYMLPINKQQYDTLVLLPQWNMKLSWE